MKLKLRPGRDRSKAVPARRRARTDASAGGTPDERYTFRRNRTLTGSLSSDVPSAAVVDADLRSPRQHAHDLRRHRRRLRLLLVASVVICVGLAGLIYNTTASVTVSATTPRPINQAIYRTKINDYLAARPLERLRFLLDTESLATYLQVNGCPEVESVAEQVTYAGFGQSHINLTMREAAAVWRSGTSQVYVDTSGHAFTQHYYPEPSVQVIDQSGISTKDNRVLASNRFLAVMGTMIGRASHYGLKTVEITLPADTTRQISIVFDGVAYPVKFTVDRGVGEQIEDASRAIRYLSTQGVSPQYLDVRVASKAYYQ